MRSILCDRGSVSPVESYVAELTRATNGRSGGRRTGRWGARPPRLLAEVRDHLDDAAEAAIADGLPRAEAERAAVASFGEVDEIAPAYRASLGLTRVRRSALALLVMMIAQPLLWGVYDHGGDQVATGALGVLNALVEGVGMVYFVGCPLLLGVTAVLLRRRDLTALTARVLGAFAVVVAVGVLALGVAMNLLSHGTPAAAPTDAAYTLLAIGPMLVPLLSAVRGARLVRG